VSYGPGELDALTPTYAANMQESQGSEWSAPRQNGHAAGVDDCWVMNSRGDCVRKRLMLPVGQPGTVAIALRSVAGRRRWLKLGTGSPQDWRLHFLTAEGGTC
jgi:exodeoxyribonuclease V alpha subunit